MFSRFLLDTHVVLRWLIEKRRLSREQLGTLERCVRRAEPLAVSGMSLLEMSLLSEEGRLKAPIERIFTEMRESSIRHSSDNL